MRVNPTTNQVSISSPGVDNLPDWLQVSGKPIVVQALLVLNTLVFALMSGTSGIRSLFIPSSQVLLHFGASSGASTIIDGQYWRALSCAFVHIGFLHLMMNCYVIFDVGPLVEKLYGWQRFLCLYLVSALGAALVSLIFNPSVISAGASGAIFGLFGALIAFFWRHRTMFPAKFWKTHMKIVIIFTLYGIAYGTIMQGVDNAAHLGGLISGFLSAMLLMPPEPGKNHFGKLAWAGCAVLLSCLLLFLAFDCRSISHNKLALGDAAYQHAVTLLKAGKSSEAISHLNTASAFLPDVASIHRDRAQAFVKLRQPEKALSDCNVAIELDPANAAGYLVRSLTYHQLNKDRQSVLDLDTAIKLDPKSAMPYNNRAWSLASIGDYPAALVDVNKAIHINRRIAVFYDTRAVVYMLCAQYNQSLTDLNRAISMNAGEGAFWYHRGCLYKRMQQMDPAAKDLRKAQAFDYLPEPWEQRLAQ